MAGELAYDDMLKRSREGRTEGISTDDLAEAVMDADSEVTSDRLIPTKRKELTDAYGGTKERKKENDALCQHSPMCSATGYRPGRPSTGTGGSSAGSLDDAMILRSTKPFHAETVKAGSPASVTNQKKGGGKGNSNSKLKVIRENYPNARKQDVEMMETLQTTVVVGMGYNGKDDGSEYLSPESAEYMMENGSFEAYSNGKVKYNPTTDKIYGDSPESRKRIEELQKEAEAKSKVDPAYDYYVRVDAESGEIKLEADAKTRVLREHALEDILIKPILGIMNLEKEDISKLNEDPSSYGRLGIKVYNGTLGLLYPHMKLPQSSYGESAAGEVTGQLRRISNITSPLTLGIGSWVGDIADSIEAGTIQYGTKAEVEARQKRDHDVAKFTTDMVVTSLTPKGIGYIGRGLGGTLSLRYPGLVKEPVVSIMSSGVALATEKVAVVGKTIEIPIALPSTAMLTGGGLGGIGAGAVAGSVQKVSEGKQSTPDKGNNQNEQKTEASRPERDTGDISNSNEEDFRGRISGNKANQFNQPKSPKYQITRNIASNIDGMDFSGHALDRMQDRGIPVSVVKEMIMYGNKTDLGSGISKYYDAKNNISIITDNNGKVITVRYGK